MTDIADAPRPKQRRGFACMTPEKRSEIARLGGLAKPADTRAYSRDRELARRAGSLGGLASARARKAEAGQ